jgi:DNA-binding protein H-NS
MPKPNLSAMSINDLLKLREDLNEVLEHKANELRSQLSRLGGTARGSLKAGVSLKGRKVPPKYRSPSGETWAGRGARPSWLVQAMKKGKKPEDFLIKGKRRVKR